MSIFIRDVQRRLAFTFRSAHLDLNGEKLMSDWATAIWHDGVVHICSADK